tara:strand:- start:308 stop:1405 length:1098 start_codon:yes stop_codon:yes gene_type:complete
MNKPTSWDTSKIKKKYGYRVVYAELDPKVFQKEFKSIFGFGMEKIKQSIKKHGIQWPVCATYKNGFYDNHFIGTQTGKEPNVGHGNSRIKAALDLGLKIPVIISDFENKFNDLPDFDEQQHIKSPANGHYTPYGYYYDLPSVQHRFDEYGNTIVDSAEEKLALCGCSWASDFDSAKYSDHEIFENSQLWQYNLGYQPIVYAQPGSTNLKIYTQVQRAIEKGFDKCLVFLTSPTRINIAWQESDGWDLQSKFQYGRTDIVNQYATKETQEYIAKYYNEDLEVLNSFVITEAIYWKLQQTGKPFRIFTNSFTQYIDHDWKVFEQPEFIWNGPAGVISQPGCERNNVPNHLSLLGQERAKQLILQHIS